MISRVRLELQGLWAYNQAAFPFADTDWQHILYDAALNKHQVAQPEIPVGSTTNTAITEIGTKRFIYPIEIEYLTKFEGTVRGNVRVKLYSNDLDLYAYLDRIKIALRTLDKDKNERLLAEYSFDASWSATKINEGFDHKAFPYTFDFAFTDYYVGARSFIFFFPIDADKHNDEYLIADITLYGHVQDHVSNPTAFFALYCEPDNNDLYFDLPIL